MQGHLLDWMYKIIMFPSRIRNIIDSWLDKWINSASTVKYNLIEIIEGIKENWRKEIKGIKEKR